MDNNILSSDQEFPLLPNLHTLCVNSNKIDDLELFLSNVQKNMPKLAYLSMLKNPACPNFFVGRHEDDYTRYRLGNYYFFTKSFYTKLFSLSKFNFDNTDMLLFISFLN